MLRFVLVGAWLPRQLTIARTRCTRRIAAEVERAIDDAWRDASARLGTLLFDGPMCRLESWQATGDRLDLLVSETSYRPFLGTNMVHPEFAERFGRDVMANPVGVSALLSTADGFLLLGRRNSSVVYYPNRLHPFAGSLEPGDLDPFDAVRRELREELSMDDDDIADMRCTGLVEDLRLSQPELIFAVETSRSLDQLASQVDETEHHSIWSPPTTIAAVEATLVTQRDQLTPVAIASLLLWGRLRFGQTWFDDASARATGASGVSPD
jgi:8-oxo-dGTP pyrophosphatase MutT (NUDIX family)